MVKELNRVSEIEVIYRPAFKATERPQIENSTDAYLVLIEHWNKERIELMRSLRGCSSIEKTACWELQRYQLEE